MNNLKRVLSLALASVMLIGMMAVGASATAVTFSDDAEITKKEAVGTMTALNIIDGMGDNTFDPKGLLLREQAAKMVFVALNGGQKNDNLTTKAVGTFSDVKAGSWAEGYIEWCYNRGIIAGMGDGTFNPKGNLTGTQLAKIMLVAIGYDAKEAGLEGTSDWALNVNALALNKGFYANLPGIDPEANITRENAAQLILNACNAIMVEYDYKVVGSNGQIDTKAIVKDKTGAHNTILTSLSSYNMDNEVKGIMTGVSLSTSGATKGTYSVVVGGNTYSKIATDYSSLLGQEVKVLKKDDTIYGVFPTDINTVTEINVSAMDGEANGTGLNVGSYIVDGKAAAYVPATTSYDTAKLIDNTGNGKYNLAVITSVDAGKVAYSSSTEIIVNGNTIKRSTNDVPADVAKGDFVSVTTDFLNSKKVVAKLESATGKVAVNADGDEYKFDGTWYNKGAQTLVAGTEYSYYTLNGVVVNATAVTATASLEDVVMITAATDGATRQVRVLRTDGTSEVLAVAPASKLVAGVDLGWDVVGDEDNLGKLYVATSTSSGYTFQALPDKVGSYTTLKADGDLAMAGGKITAIGSYTISDDAIVMVYGGKTNLKDGKIITGKVLKELTKDTKYSGDEGVANDKITGFTGGFISKVNNLTRASIVAVALNDGAKNFPGATLTGTNFGLIVADAIQVDAKHVQYSVWTGTETVEVTEETGAGAAAREQFDVINYDEIKDNVISGVAVIAQSKSLADAKTKVVALPAYSVESTKLWVGENDYYKLTGDTVYLYFDSSATKAADIGKAEGTLVAADEVVTGVKMPNVKILADSTTGTEVVFALVDIKNKLVDDKTDAAYNYTLTLQQGTLDADENNYALSDDVTITVSKQANIHYGETLTVSIKVAKGKSLAAKTIYLDGAVALADGTSTTLTTKAVVGADNTANAGTTQTFQIVATGNVTVSYDATITP